MDDGDPRAALDEAERELADVERALERLDAGTYGRCERCDAALGDDALAGDPLTRRCADCR